MSKNEGAMSILSDEGGVFDIMSGLYSNGRANIDLFLQSHSASPVRVDRGSKPPILLDKAILSMGLSIQPLTLETICNDKKFIGRGLVARFLYVVPTSNLGYRNLDAPSIAEEIIQKYHLGIMNLLKHLECYSNQENFHVYLELTSEAYEKWLEYARLIEGLMNEEVGVLSHMTDWAAKLPGAVARISGLLHVMRYHNSRPWDNPISFEDMANAVKIGQCLVYHALKAYSLIDKSLKEKVAEKILSWIKSFGASQFTFRECQRGIRGYKKEQLRLGLDLLKEHEYLKEWEHKPEKGAPSVVFDVNPYFLK